MTLVCNHLGSSMQELRTGCEPWHFLGEGWLAVVTLEQESILGCDLLFGSFDRGHYILEQPKHRLRVKTRDKNFKVLTRRRLHGKQLDPARVGWTRSFTSRCSQTPPSATG
eukprot:4719963-Lingulodinium_polyedra.AAC.1